MDGQNPLLQQPATAYIGKVAQTVPARIANGATTTDAIDLGGCTLAGMIFPAAFTGATINPQASNDGTNFFNLYNASGTQYAITVTTSAWVAVNPTDYEGIRYLKFTCSSQAAARELGLIARKL